MTELSTLLACPRCSGALENLRCSACRVTYPRRGSIPWLFADPDATASDWKNRWQLATERLRFDLRRVEHSLTAGGLSDPTRRRLTALAAGYRAQLGHLERILAPLTAGARHGGALETLLALRTRLPAGHGIFSYEANVHRDWCWGEQECGAAIEAVLEGLDERRSGNVLVLGAGAGRLAYDLHQRTTVDLTAAVDLNPLLVYVGARVSAGETLELIEFPLAPREPAAAAVCRTLRAPEPSRPGLEFVMADAMRPPFRPGSFDAVITPWLLDVMETSTAQVLCLINALLRDGGVWVNQGSIAFDGPDPADRLTLDELLQAAGDAGFHAVVTSDRSFPT